MSEVATSDTNKMVVVDLGKQKRKKINNLRKGKGDLVGKVEDLIGELRTEGVVQASAQVVVVVVKEKRRLSKISVGSLLR